MLITAQHVAQIPYQGKHGYCLPGVRVFCQRYGIKYWQFKKYGIDSEVLLATGDHMAKELVEFVEKNYG